MASSLFTSACPSCGARAPIVLHGLDSRCAACGAPRFLLAAPNTNFAGQPSRWGGRAASLAGIVVLILGLSIALGLCLLLQSLFPAHWVGLAFAVPLAAASLLFGILLMVGGRRLRMSGDAKSSEVKLAAVRSFVEHRRGPISAFQVAQKLELPEPEVDALLTQLARKEATAVTLDVDDAGHVVYDFEGEDRRWRVLEEEAATDELQGAAERLRRPNG